MRGLAFGISVLAVLAAAVLAAASLLTQPGSHIATQYQQPWQLAGAWPAKALVSRGMPRVWSARAISFSYTLAPWAQGWTVDLPAGLWGNSPAGRTRHRGIREALVQRDDILSKNIRTILEEAQNQMRKLGLSVSAAADESEVWHAKISPGLALHLQKLAAEHRLSEMMSVLILIHGELGPALQAKLEGAGLTIRGAAGNVISGAIRAAELASLGQVADVVLIDFPKRFSITPPPVELDPSK
jgi:hypothetical protein